MGAVRNLKKQEISLLVALITGKPQAAQLLDSLVHARVEEMNDGGMGSLRFRASDEKSRRFGNQLVEKEFFDSDGTPVMIAVNLDERGNLY